MGRASKHQKDYWWPKVVKIQHGEYCRGCGSTENLVLDKINNDGNHNICDNEPKDFQILCKSCNGIKNPRGEESPRDLDMTQSEKKNQSAEKPMMDNLKMRLEKGEVIEWDQWVCDAAFEFDVQADPTIEKRYYKKYFKSKKGPFELYSGQFDRLYIRLKDTET